MPNGFLVIRVLDHKGLPPLFSQLDPLGCRRVHTDNNSNPRQSWNVYGLSVSLSVQFRTILSRFTPIPISYLVYLRPINRQNRHSPDDLLYFCRMIAFGYPGCDKPLYMYTYVYRYVYVAGLRHILSLFLHGMHCCSLDFPVVL